MSKAWHRFNTALMGCLAAALLSACGGGGGTDPAPIAALDPTLSSVPSPPTTLNTLSVVVDQGPNTASYNVNRLYTTVTVCTPGSSTQCQTIDHVLVDTGSTGLRLLSSVMAPGLNLSRVNAPGGQPLLGCVQFVDLTYAWGPVARADLVLGGMKAANIPIQMVADPAYSNAPRTCSAGGNALQTVQDLGANGILGLGLLREDHGAYFTCSNANCFRINHATAPLSDQVAQPVARFTSHNNGLLIDLPAVNAPLASLTGTLIFGIGTQSNNLLTGTRLSSGSFGSLGVSTVYGVQTLTTSYIDTGSNAFFFDAGSALARCGTGLADFYCPTAFTPSMAMLLGADGTSFPVSFAVANASTLFASGQSVLPNLSGAMSGLTAFDWGLPFFYGRRAFFGIQGVNGEAGYYAFEASQY